MSMLVEYTAPVWRSLDMRALKVDEAYLHLHSHLGTRIYLYILSEACYKCPYTKTKAFGASAMADADGVLQSAASNATIPINIARGLSFKIYDQDVGRYAFDNSTALCTLHNEYLQEFGVYNLTIAANGSCSLSTDKPGVNVNYSLLSVFVIVASALILLKSIAYMWRRYRYDEAAAAATSIDEATKITQRKRLHSLDAFRGLAIVLMIFVNSGGGDYWWIDHSIWNGLHLADVVFPSFLWIMGVAIPISVKAQLVRGTTKARLCCRIAWRAFKLFAIGVCLNSVNGPALEQLRIMGVLQRFGIAYLVCGILQTLCSRPEHFVTPIPTQPTWRRSFHDLYIFYWQFAAMLALMATYLGIVFYLYVPGCPRGYLGPGGKHALAAYPNCIGGATGYIDRSLLTNAHIYQHPTAKYVYDVPAFDPEGVFGCLLTIVQVLFGVLAGVTLLVHKDWKSRTKRWLAWSLLLGLLGAVLCGFSREYGIIPVNKNLWSLSFVFVTAAIAFSLLALLYFIIDVRRYWYGFPFMECGMNAIILYVGHTIMHKMLPWHWRMGAMNTHFMLLLEAIWNTLIWVGIAIYLDAKDFYYSL